MSDEMLLAPTADGNRHAAWPAFERFCKASHVDTTVNAWLMFLAGWEALEAKLQAHATNWWCDQNEY